MKLNQLVKAHGLKSVTELEELTGESARTMRNWSQDKPRLLECVLLGAVEAKRRKLTGQ